MVNRLHVVALAAISVSLVSLVSLASLAGCNSIAGINDPANGTSSDEGGTTPDEGGTTVDESGTPIDTGLPTLPSSRFVGTWNPTSLTSGTQMVTCPGQTPGSKQTGIVLIIAAGATGDAVFLTPKGTTCAVPATISGDTATVTTGSGCVFTDSTETDTYSYVPATSFKLLAGDQTALGVYSANLEIDNANGTFDCTYRETESYVKAP